MKPLLVVVFLCGACGGAPFTGAERGAGDTAPAADTMSATGYAEAGPDGPLIGVAPGEDGAVVVNESGTPGEPDARAPAMADSGSERDTGASGSSSGGGSSSNGGAADAAADAGLCCAYQESALYPTMTLPCGSSDSSGVITVVTCSGGACEVSSSGLPTHYSGSVVGCP